MLVPIQKNVHKVENILKFTQKIVRVGVENSVGLVPLIPSTYQGPQAVQEGLVVLSCDDQGFIAGHVAKQLAHLRGGATLVMSYLCPSLHK